MPSSSKLSERARVSPSMSTCTTRVVGMYGAGSGRRGAWPGGWNSSARGTAMPASAVPNTITRSSASRSWPSYRPPGSSMASTIRPRPADARYRRPLANVTMRSPSVFTMSGSSTPSTCTLVSEKLGGAWPPAGASAPSASAAAGAAGRARGSSRAQARTSSQESRRRRLLASCRAGSWRSDDPPCPVSPSAPLEQGAVSMIAPTAAATVVVRFARVRKCLVIGRLDGQHTPPGSHPSPRSRAVRPSGSLVDMPTDIHGDDDDRRSAVDPDAEPEPAQPEPPQPTPDVDTDTGADDDITEPLPVVRGEYTAEPPAAPTVGAGPPPVDIGPGPEPSGRPGRNRRRALIAGLVAAILALVGFGALLLVAGDDDDDSSPTSPSSSTTTSTAPSTTAALTPAPNDPATIPTTAPSTSTSAPPTTTTTQPTTTTAPCASTPPAPPTSSSPRPGPRGWAGSGPATSAVRCGVRGCPRWSSRCGTRIPRGRWRRGARGMAGAVGLAHPVAGRSAKAMTPTIPMAPIRATMSSCARSRAAVRWATAPYGDTTSP